MSDQFESVTNHILSGCSCSRHRRLVTSLINAWEAAFIKREIKYERDPDSPRVPLLSGRGQLDIQMTFWLPQVHMWAFVQANELKEADPMCHLFQLIAIQSGQPVLILDGRPEETKNYWAFEPYPLHSDGVEDDSRFWMADYKPIDGNDYHLSESRFYSHTGNHPFEREPLWPGAGEVGPSR